MINAGAIAACSLVAGDSLEARYERVRATFSRAADRELALDEAIFRADLAVAHRHRAIGHLLRGSGVIEGDPDPAVELYFRQCALQLDARDMALMAATLANGGVQPRTGERLFEPAVVERVLSVMATCGMYDAAGEWVVDVGLPAKSGVGGGVLAVLPGPGRDRALLAAAGPPRQQRPRRRGVPAALARPRAALPARGERAPLGDPLRVGRAHVAVEPPPHARRAGGAQRARRPAPACTRSTATCCSRVRSPSCGR